MKKYILPVFLLLLVITFMSPGSPCGNWQWRLRPGTDFTEPARWLRHVTELYGRR